MKNIDYQEKYLIDRITRPLFLFSQHKLAGAGLLLFSAVVAILLANSAFSSTYTSILQSRFTVGIGAYSLSKPLLLWINDGMMGIFFFVVGLEIKRELLAGELSSREKACFLF